jgi:hypothetical protein
MEKKGSKMIKNVSKKVKKGQNESKWVKMTKKRQFSPTASAMKKHLKSLKMGQNGSKMTKNDQN